MVGAGALVGSGTLRFRGQILSEAAARPPIDMVAPTCTRSDVSTGLVRSNPVTADV